MLGASGVARAPAGRLPELLGDVRIMRRREVKAIIRWAENATRDAVVTEQERDKIVTWISAQAGPANQGPTWRQAGLTGAIAFLIVVLAWLAVLLFVTVKS